MKRAEFFTVASVTRSKVFVEQGDNKYDICIEVKYEGEESIKYTLDANIKSLDSVATILREKGIFEFPIKIKNEEIIAEKRNPKTTDVKTTEK